MYCSKKVCSFMNKESVQFGNKVLLGLLLTYAIHEGLLFLADVNPGLAMGMVLVMIGFGVPMANGVPLWNK